ncbi:MAG: ABC transporter ATP-binding protein [Mogibacterium sp.]|nr:ABC transporter ATP-binding protein [Mogibacterium sp.]
MKLEINNLSVKINKTKILDDVSLGIKEREFLVLLGPSGCGKSTLLKTIAGINYVDEGTIVLDGTVLNDVPAHKRGTVIVFQDIRLFPNMSVADNVTYALRFKGIKKKSRREKAGDLLRSVQLEGFEDRMPSTLSGGQMQRVALARALAAEPKLILLDEPFSSLDENLREDMRNLVKKLHHEFGMTTIMVTHDREEAFSMADRLAVMFEGKIVQTGTPENVLSAPADERVRRYFGRKAVHINEERLTKK